jgi:hypothetical protein
VIPLAVSAECEKGIPLRQRCDTVSHDLTKRQVRPSTPPRLDVAQQAQFLGYGSALCDAITGEHCGPEVIQHRRVLPFFERKSPACFQPAPRYRIRSAPTVIRVTPVP